MLTILQAIKQVWQTEPNKSEAVMLWAVSCTCFFDFLRSGEAVLQSESDYNTDVHLSYGDIQVNNAVSPQFVVVHLKASKTDPFRKHVLGLE